MMQSRCGCDMPGASGARSVMRLAAVTAQRRLVAVGNLMPVDAPVEMGFWSVGWLRALAPVRAFPSV